MFRLPVSGVRRTSPDQFEQVRRVTAAGDRSRRGRRQKATLWREQKIAGKLIKMQLAEIEKSSQNMETDADRTRITDAETKN